MSERTRFIGLDVHKATIAVAVAEGFGDPEDHGTIANDPSAVRKLMGRLGGPDVHLKVAYEAGPTGYALHRQLTGMGIEQRRNADRKEEPPWTRLSLWCRRHRPWSDHGWLRRA